MLDIRNAKYVVRQGGSYSRGTTIDGYLSEEDCNFLYANWKQEWPEPLKFHGGTTAITCEMVLEVPEKELKAVLGKHADNIIAVSKRNAS